MTHISRNNRCIYVPDECINVDELLVGYRAEFKVKQTCHSKNYSLKIFWTCKSNTVYSLYALRWKKINQVHKNLG